MVKMQNFDISIQTLQKMLRQGLTLQILNQTDHCLKEKIKIGSMKHKLGGQIMMEFVGLRAKQIYLFKRQQQSR